MRYDSLMVRALARELDARLRGVRLRALVFDSDTRVHLVTANETLTADLHPANGIFQLSSEPIDSGRGAFLPGQARIHRVSAPPDERVLEFEISGRHSGGSIRKLIIELITNQWNAIALRESDVIAAVLRSRTGARRLEPRVTYEAPPATARAGSVQGISREEWHYRFASIAAEDRPAIALREIAWTSPLNIRWIFDGEPSMDEAWARYKQLIEAVGGAHYENDGEAFAYAAGMPGAIRTFDTLLEAIAALAAPARVTIEQIRNALERERRKLRRLHAQADEAAQNADRLRSHAALVLAYSGSIRRGADRAVLTDTDGNDIEIALDPSVSAVENANRMYAEARKRDRAAERLPQLIGETEARVSELESLIARAEAGEDVRAETAAWTPVQKVRAAPKVKLPFRRYRTTGGLEVRVGKNARANDELTLYHSAPNDIWLHARDVGGAHVVLRWPNPDSNPPRQDLIEAAVLAAIFSRSRSSSTAAVDWTRRKYVRKPRKAAPGSVVVERAQTLFVEPDPALEKRLRVDADQE